MSSQEALMKRFAILILAVLAALVAVSRRGRERSERGSVEGPGLSAPIDLSGEAAT
jgi:hypothetical protein